MSSNFLQRFKGKTQTISKDGVHNILGGSANNAQSTNSTSNPYIYTHSNGLASQQKYISTQSRKINDVKYTTQSIDKKPSSQKNMSKTNNQKFSLPNKPKHQPTKSNQIEKKSSIPDNPFLISNPFYLDQQQKLQEQARQIQLLKLQKMQAQKKKLQQNKKTAYDPKKGTYSTSMNVRNSSFSKQTQKQWSKLGGLGPNIGGEQWQERKKKLQKMQEFANQVKAINLQKAPLIPKLVNKNEEKKDDVRSKALEYSKKVPKPVVKTYEKQQKQEDSYQINESDRKQLSELQLYELRHKQLQEVLRNQL